VFRWQSHHVHATVRSRWLDPPADSFRNRSPPTGSARRAASPPTGPRQRPGNGYQNALHAARPPRTAARPETSHHGDSYPVRNPGTRGKTGGPRRIIQWQPPMHTAGHRCLQKIRRVSTGSRVNLLVGSPPPHKTAHPCESAPRPWGPWLIITLNLKRPILEFFEFGYSPELCCAPFSAWL